MTHKDSTPCQTNRAQPAQTVRGILNWIVETDRKFRMTQNRIDQFSDRF